MDWDRITKDALTAMRGSRLRGEIRSEGATITGLSLEDYIQSGLQEYLQCGGTLEKLAGETDHDALVREICRIAALKAENDRRNRDRRRPKNYEWAENTRADANVFVDPSLSGLILGLFSDDAAARDIVIIILDGMAEFGDTQLLSEITEIPIRSVENTKKRIKRKVRQNFTGDDAANSDEVR
jgi:hypothetical protein